MHMESIVKRRLIIFLQSTETKQFKLIHFSKRVIMLSEDDQDRSKYIMTLKKKDFKQCECGWVVKINDFNFFITFLLSLKSLFITLLPFFIVWIKNE